MVVENIDVNQTLEKARELLKKEKNLSPAFASVIEILILLVSLLANRLGLNSRNSSIPPSKEPLRHHRSKSPGRRKKPGGQKGHCGATLEKIDNPNEIEDILIDRKTLPAGHYKNAGFEARQVFDMKVSLHVTEYRAEILKDQNGKEFVANFPDGVVCAAQYGPEVRAQSVYLSQFQLIPLARVEDHFDHQVGLALSKGTISNFNREAYERLESFESWVKKQLLSSKINHSDETGIRVDGKTFWLHTLGNDKFTFYHPDPQRGKPATDRMGILPQYQGTLCHDHWKPYYRYDSISHALCNAHHLRELERAHEQEAQQWAKKMQTFLVKLNKKTEQSGGVLKKTQIARYQKQYRAILEKGEKECPTALKVTGKRGRTKQSFSRNLLDRFKNFEDDTLRFMTKKEVPFTNNQAERDLRMTKVQQKISGCFRSLEGAQIFCRVRAFLSTCQKHHASPTDALRNLFLGKLPTFINDG
jgi:transposase